MGMFAGQASFFHGFDRLYATANFLWGCLTTACLVAAWLGMCRPKSLTNSISLWLSLSPRSPFCGLEWLFGDKPESKTNYHSPALPQPNYNSPALPQPSNIGALILIPCWVIPLCFLMAGRSRNDYSSWSWD